jgi:hypothetical protein
MTVSLCRSTKFEETTNVSVYVSIAVFLSEG